MLSYVSLLHKLYVVYKTKNKNTEQQKTQTKNKNETYFTTPTFKALEVNEVCWTVSNLTAAVHFNLTSKSAEQLF